MDLKEKDIEQMKEENDISKIPINIKGINSKKVIGVIILIFSILLIALLFKIMSLNEPEEKPKKETTESKDVVVKDNVLGEEKDSFKMDLKNSYKAQTKKITSTTTNTTNDVTVINQQPTEVNNYESERLAEIKAKISAYRDKEFQEELASRGSSIGQDISISVNNNSSSSKDEFQGNSQGNSSSVYNRYSLMKPISSFELKAGGIIPIILYTGVKTSIQSKIIGVVRENIYDTVTGNYLLIPKGTKALGTYGAVLTFGQERVMLIWERLVFPNGKSISLDKFDGVDLSGYGGSGGIVNSHFGSLLKAVVLSSLLSVGDYYVSPSYKDRNNGTTTSPDIIIREESISTLSEVGKEYINKTLSIPPEITIKQGTRLNILINRDLVLEPYKE